MRRFESARRLCLLQRLRAARVSGPSYFGAVVGAIRALIGSSGRAPPSLYAWPLPHTNQGNVVHAPRLTEPIKREVELDGQHYTLTIGPKGMHIAPKGKRKGHELSWRDLASGDAELNRDLVRSLTKPAKRGGARSTSD
jgi:hypothetical protein